MKLLKNSRNVRRRITFFGMNEDLFEEITYILQHNKQEAEVRLTLLVFLIINKCISITNACISVD